MRTSLGRDRNTRSLRVTQQRNRLRRRKMNDMNARPKLAAQTNHQLDRFILRRARPGSEKRRIVVYWTTIHSTSATDDWIQQRSRQLRMHDQQRIEPPQLRHRLAQVLFSNM